MNAPSHRNSLELQILLRFLKEVVSYINELKN